jgi:hypothetical protein
MRVLSVALVLWALGPVIGCDEAATVPAAAALTCRDRVEGAPGLPTFERSEDFVVGPVVFDGLKGTARRVRRHPSAVARRYRAGEGAVKILAGVRAGARVRVAVAPRSRPFVGFVYGPSRDPRDPRDRVQDGEQLVEFRGCPANERRRDGEGSVGARTYFAGGLLVAEARCLHLRVSVGGGPVRRYGLAYGVPNARCAPISSRYRHH